MKIKKNPKQNLENYSSIFSLLGLVLSLFITLVFIEQKTYAAETVTLEPVNHTITMDDTPIMVNVIREKKLPKNKPIHKIKEPVEPKKAPDPNNFKKSKDDVIIEPITIKNNIGTIETIDLDDVDYVEDIEEAGTETIPFISVENIPVFPGCEKYINHKEKSKKCFNKNMSKFFGENFDLGIAQDLNLYGMQKINCQFIINTQGEISPDIETSKTHPELAEAIKNVIKKLPKMIPAKQNGKPVNLIYMLPVRFYAE